MPYKDPTKQKYVQRIDASNRNYIKRFTVIQFLGGSCLDCGEDDFRCLQIDHITPILRVEKYANAGNVTVMNVYMDRIAVEDLQVLCANCHAVKSFNDRTIYSNYIGDD